MEREFIFTDRWLDFLFENRNRSYGAYVLRKRQPDNVLIGWVTAVVFLGVVTFTGYQLNKISVENTRALIEKINKDKEVILSAISYVVTIPDKIEAPKSIPSANKNVISNVAPVVTDTKIIDAPKTEIKTVETTVINTGDPVNTTDDKNGSGGTNNSLPVFNSTKPFLMPAKMPEFPGGEEAIIKFLQKHTRYPQKYLKDMINGTVWISFVVNAEGFVTDIEVKNGIEGHPEFSDAAIESISKMPRWTPGQQNEMNVPVLFTVPVKFSVK